MDDNLNFIVRLFERKQLLNVLVLFSSALRRVDFYNLVFIVATEEVIRGDIFPDFLRVVSVLCHNENKRLHDLLAVSPSINLKVALCLFMQTDTVIQLFMVKLFGRVFLRSKILTSKDHWHFDILPVVQRMGKRVFIDHILEVYFSRTFLNLRSSRQFHAQNRAQLINDIKALIRVVVMAFIHEDAQVIQRLQVRKIGLPKHLIQTLNTSWAARRSLTVRIQLCDIKNVDNNIIH